MTGDRGFLSFPAAVMFGSSGEIADQNVLMRFMRHFPKAKVGTPTPRQKPVLPSPLTMGKKASSVVGGQRSQRSRNARSRRCPSYPFGTNGVVLCRTRAPALKDAEGFVDTGDLFGTPR